MAKTNITLVGAGGTGVNIVKRFIDRDQVDFAKFDIFMLDTSESNTVSGFSERLFYKFDGSKDGSGKHRPTNVEPIKQRMPTVLQLLPANDLTVIVHSGGGGSGSVIGPVLAEELLKRNKQVIVIMVGTTNSVIEAENTLKTIRTYAKISHTVNKPVVLSYFENAEKGRSQVNADIEVNLVLLSALLSPRNVEMDTEDLVNFLNFNRVTKFGPTLALMEIHNTNEIKLHRDQNIISVMTMTDHSASDRINGVQPGYQSTTILGEEVAREIRATLPIHFVTLTNGLVDKVKALEEMVSKAEDVANACVVTPLLNQHDLSGDSLIL